MIVGGVVAPIKSRRGRNLSDANATGADAKHLVIHELIITFTTMQ
jgi:hypothetical protein